MLCFITKLKVGRLPAKVHQPDPPILVQSVDPVVADAPLGSLLARMAPQPVLQQVAHVFGLYGAALIASVGFFVEHEDRGRHIVHQEKPLGRLGEMVAIQVLVVYV